MTPDPTFLDALAAADRPLTGMWLCTGSPLVAEICAGSGLDWLLIHAEHSPNGLTRSSPSSRRCADTVPSRSCGRPPSTR
ncbi:hypothetical protein ACFYY3_05270 [Streptomyces sp. NPDC001812]|uniref:hypothetical protein n=1 Tax=Streptomyces sp. NPDC001812 TaxID=3364611 RepID=UPI0036CC5B16